MGKPSIKSHREDDYVPFEVSVTKDLANAYAYMDISNRAIGSTGKVYDLFDGTNEWSSGTMDTSSTTLSLPVTAGTTVLTSKVPSITGFAVGQEVTIYDDSNQENVTITRADSGSGTVSLTTPVNVVAGTSISTNQNQRKIVRDSLGNLYACAYRTVSSYTQVVVCKSVDNGVSWTDCNFPATASYNQYYPIIAVDSSNNVYVLWVGTDGSYNTKKNVKLVKSTTGGASWGSVIYVTTGNTYDMSHPTMVIDSANNIHVCYEGATATVYETMFYTKSTNGGTSFNSTITIASGSGTTVYQNFSNIAVDSSNNPCIVWCENTSNKYNVKFVKSTNGGTSFGSIVAITTGSTYNQNYPTLAVESANNIHVSWNGNDSTDTVATNIKYSKSSDGGSTWGAVIKITSGNTYYQSFPHLCLDASNNIHIVWSGNDATYPSMSQIRYAKSTNGGTSFGAVTNLTTNTLSSQSYVSVCDNYKNFTEPVCVWMSSGEGYMKFRGVFTANVKNLEVTATANAYKQGGVVTRSTAAVSGGKLGFSVPSLTVLSDTIASPSSIQIASGNSINNHKRLTRLSNGWLIAAVNYFAASGDYIFKSMDSGATWSYVTRIPVSGGGGNNGSEICSYGNMVYVVATTGGGDLNFYKFDPTGTYTDPAIAINIPANGSTYNYQGNICVDSSGNIYITTAGYSTSYPSNVNIRGTRSSNGGTTWDALSFITSGTGVQYGPGSLIATASGAVGVFAYNNNSTTYGMTLIKYNGGWSNQGVFFSQTGYGTAEKSLSIDSNGYYHLAFAATDSTDTTAYNIRYMQSTNSGGSWSSVTKLTSGNVNTQRTPSIIADTSGNVYVYWVGNGNIRRIRSTNGGSSFGSVQEYITGGAAAGGAVSVYEGYKTFIEPLFIYYDPTSTAVKYCGKFSNSVTPTFLSVIARYNITPPPGTTNNFLAWVYRERYVTDPWFSISGYLSATDVGATESYTAMTKVTNNLAANLAEEVLTMTDLATPKADITFKLVITRMQSVITSAVTKFLGGVL